MVRPWLVASAWLLVAGCGPSDEGTPIQSWWGPLDSEDGGTPFDAGGSFEVHGFAARTLVGDAPQRDLIHVALVSSDGGATCAGYGNYLQELAAIQAELDAARADEELDSDSHDLIGWTCQEIAGASRRAFGGDGSYRAIHALLDVSDGGPDSGLFFLAPPGAVPDEYEGAELLTASTSVWRVFERSQHGADILPAGASGAWLNNDIDPVTGCTSMLPTLVNEALDADTTYPDVDGLAISSATHRYYHRYTSQQEIQFDADDEPFRVGGTLPGWDQAGSDRVDMSFSIFGAVARAPETFPYTDALYSTRSRTVSVEPCDALASTLDVLWPELLDPAAGDDDDSADR